MCNKKLTAAKTAKTVLCYAAAPLAVLIILAINFYVNELFPFGDGTISWCDMSQQVVPLLCNFKDMLAGKSGVFLNLQNAGGMNMWGVIFFFVVSPFSSLVIFVDKIDMIYFVNILLILKLMTCSLTAFIYFRACHKRLYTPFAVILSVTYAFCGYGMLFYQNIIWLDIMYLFPLLMISFKSLTQKGNIIPYTAVLTAFMVVNYYISYMAVIFILLFFALYCFMFCKNEKGENSYKKKVPLLFLLGSILAALISAVVWVPCFMQYLSSGRGKSVIETLSKANFISNYQTTIPLILCTAGGAALVLWSVCSGALRSRKNNMYLILFLLTLIPIIIEPVNIMWHTGNYMSFPARYGFITIFMELICCAYFLKSDNKGVLQRDISGRICCFAVCSAVLALFIYFYFGFTKSNLEELSHYTLALWGNETSFRYLLEMFLVALTVFFVFIFAYKKGWLSKRTFAFFLAAAVAVEAYCNTDIYISSADKHNPYRGEDYQQVMDLSEKIQDDDFYRVTTSSKLFDVNLVGAMGYNSISHYTSLTDKDYMYTIKRMGYSSYWMEVGSYGATEITDSVLCVKYKIYENSEVENNHSVYENSTYQIKENEYYMPLGVITQEDVGQYEDISNLSRSQVQQLFYSKFLGGEGEAVKEYDFDSSSSVEISGSEGDITIVPKGEFCVLSAQIDVQGRQSLYFDAFGTPSNNLKESYYDGFSVSVNGKTIDAGYPSQKQNGLLKLGEFEDEEVLVAIKVKKSVKLSCFGIFGIDLQKVSQAVSQSKTAALNYEDGKVKGECNAKQGENCVIAIPYSEDITVRINGEKVEFSKAFGDFICVPLIEGENEIIISSTPRGFYLGLILTLLGFAALGGYMMIRRKISCLNVLSLACLVSVIGVGCIILAVIYIIPCIVNIVV